MNTQCAAANDQMLGDRDASVKPSPTHTAPISSGTNHAAAVGEPSHEDAAEAEADQQHRVGKRRRPRARRRTPPARPAAPSTTTYMPPLPIVISASATSRRLTA